jgi:hypothetical protein
MNQEGNLPKSDVFYVGEGGRVVKKLLWAKIDEETKDENEAISQALDSLDMIGRDKGNLIISASGEFYNRLEEKYNISSTWEKFGPQCSIYKHQLPVFNGMIVSKNGFRVSLILNMAFMHSISTGILGFDCKYDIGK